MIAEDTSFVESKQSISSAALPRGKKGFLKVEVLDNGVGINQNSISRLFGMFAQANQTVASVHGGTGLGLWICKQLCNKMGGDITIYSEMNKGTSFVFYLPVDNTQLPEVVENEIPRRREKLRALVVDDYEYNRNIHRLLLEKEGVEVHIACDGREAVDRFKSEEENFFDFIFMDIQMPVMNGFDATKMIRSYEAKKRYKEVDVYFISGDYYSQENLKEKLGESGCPVRGKIVCMKKPINTQFIKEVLE